MTPDFREVVMGDRRFDADHAAILHSMQQDRGWIVNSYAQVEYLMADTIVRCREFAVYDHLTRTMPYQTSQRATRFARLLEVEGPLSAQRDAFHAVIDHFNEWNERRQFLVHGFATFLWAQNGDAAMRFDRFMPSVEDQFGRRSMVFRPATLSEIRNRTTTEAQLASQTFVELHTRLGWVGETNFAA
jgi:hypothetical protein